MPLLPPLTSRGRKCFILQLALSLSQAGEWDKWCLPAAAGPQRGGEWKGFWVRLPSEKDECSGQTDSDPPSVAAADRQWGGGRPHTPQAANTGEASPSGAQIWTLTIRERLIWCFALCMCWCSAGVFSPEVSRPAEEDSVCSCRGGTVCNEHQPLCHQREQVQ